MKYTKEYLLSWHWSIHADASGAELVPDSIDFYRAEGVRRETRCLSRSQENYAQAAAIILAHSNRDWASERTNRLWDFGTPTKLFALWIGADINNPYTAAMINGVMEAAADSMECPVRQEAEKTRQHLVEMGLLPADGVQLKVKRLHPDAIMPKYQSAGAACFDLHALLLEEEEPTMLRVFGSAIFATGLSFEIPQGWVMLIFSRSGDGFKRDLRLANCVGVIDSDYRGEVKVKLTHDVPNGAPPVVRNGDRIAQAMLVQIPQVDLVEVSELSSTERGEAGFGSTGA